MLHDGVMGRNNAAIKIIGFIVFGEGVECEIGNMEEGVVLTGKKREVSNCPSLD